MGLKKIFRFSFRRFISVPSVLATRRQILPRAYLIMELYTIRHGKTTANEKNISASRMKGYYDNLSEKGIRQAQELISKLKKHKFDAVIISPMKRTKKTLQPYLDSLKIRPKVIVLDIVNERDTGDLAGKTNEEVTKIKKSSGDNFVEWVPLNGESQIHVNLRVKKFVEYLKKNFK